MRGNMFLVRDAFTRRAAPGRSEAGGARTLSRGGHQAGEASGCFVKRPSFHRTIRDSRNFDPGERRAEGWSAVAQLQQQSQQSHEFS